MVTSAKRTLCCRNLTDFQDQVSQRHYTAGTLLKLVAQVFEREPHQVAAGAYARFSEQLLQR